MHCSPCTHASCECSAAVRRQEERIPRMHASDAATARLRSSSAMERFRAGPRAFEYRSRASSKTTLHCTQCTSDMRASHRCVRRLHRCDAGDASDPRRTAFVRSGGTRAPPRNGRPPAATDLPLMLAKPLRPTVPDSPANSRPVRQLEQSMARATATAPLGFRPTRRAMSRNLMSVHFTGSTGRGGIRRSTWSRRFGVRCR